MTESVTVAIINTTPDTVEMVRDALHPVGFVVVACFANDIRDGKIDFGAFVRLHRPRVTTSVNAKNAQGLVGRDAHVYEIVDREEDLLRLCRPSRKPRARETHA